jgi:hypothetical protein
MADWARLGEYVVARRIALGYQTRVPFADASGISTRILGDIETGRRGRFDRKTIAALENTLGWATGSAVRIVEGGEPTLVPVTLSASVNDRIMLSDSVTATVTPALEFDPETRDEAIIRVMKSNLSTEQKKQVVQMLIAEKRRAEQQRVEHAEELIRLLGDDR